MPKEKPMVIETATGKAIAMAIRWSRLAALKATGTG
jgi:hypothetical protein